MILEFEGGVLCMLAVFRDAPSWMFNVPRAVGPVCDWILLMWTQMDRLKAKGGGESFEMLF
jgi:hypothetical protein